MKFTVVLAFSITLSASAALASGTLFYGSRAGMEVTVVSMSGLDTAKAVIHTKHTRENAIAFCREYVQNVTPDCIKEEMAVRLNDSIRANCKTGVFTDFGGTKYKFLGANHGNDEMAKYRLLTVSTGEVANGSSASGYPTNMQIFHALCPRKAPMDY